MLILAHSFWDDLQDPLKVTFDGPNRLININPNVSDVDIKKDVYSAWKRWVMRDNNAAYPAALRVTGGDPIGGGQFTGDVYFTINGWRIFVDHTCDVTGVIYSDDYDSPWMPAGGTNIVTNKVSALVNTVTTSGSTITVSEITNGVWNEPTSTHVVAGSFGKLQQMIYDLSDAIKGVADSTLLKATDTKDETALIKSDTTTIKADTSTLKNDTNTIKGDLTSIGGDITTIDSNLTSVKGTVEATQTTISAMDLDINTIVSIVNTLLKYEKNRTRVDKNAYTLTVYDDDGVTPLKIFNLKDFTGAASYTEVAERMPLP
jgi:hypothetical protein